MKFFEKNNRRVFLILLMAVAAIAVAVISVSVGSANMGADAFFRLILQKMGILEGLASNQEMILLDIRLPRVLLSFFVGGALSFCGTCMQGVFKNPMADPHILGVSSGSALGATIAIASVGTAMQAQIGVVGCAFIGGIASVFIVYRVALVNGRMTTVGLLLSGTAVSALFTAVIHGIMILNHDKMERIVLWTMGSLSTAGWNQVLIGVPVMVAGMIPCFFFARDLNIMLLGEEEAYHLGVKTQQVRAFIMIFTALVVSAAVSVSGLIGFVGLMVPHMLRLICGPDHKLLLPASFLGGGIFLMLCDMAARTLASPLEIPVGVITALLGAPFFIYLLRRRKGVS
ncbi:MAG: FecCD family ABC transporter permease [Christensenellales bacterium]|jgi:iron complex transport system permease protein